jgi:hypothetical protein
MTNDEKMRTDKRTKRTKLMQLLFTMSESIYEDTDCFGCTLPMPKRDFYDDSGCPFADDSCCPKVKFGDELADLEKLIIESPIFEKNPMLKEYFLQEHYYCYYPYHEDIECTYYACCDDCHIKIRAGK